MSLLRAAGGVLGQHGAGGVAFNPQTDITWHSLFWAEGTNFVANRSPSDGGAIGTWDNETGESDATQATGANQPLYRATYVNLNNQPAIEGDGGDDGLATADFSVDPSYTSGVSLVVILGNAPASDTFISGNDGSNRNQMGFNVSRNLTMRNTGSDLTGSNVISDQAHMVVGYFNTSGNEVAYVDGVLEIDSNSGAANETLDGLRLFTNAAGTANFNGAIAFAGIYEGDFTADGSYADFVTWAETHYGLTIA